MARPKPLSMGTSKKPVSCTVTFDDYNWVARQPGLEFSAILRAGIKSLRERAEDDPANYQKVADEVVRIASGGIEKDGPHTEVEAQTFYSWQLVHPEVQGLPVADRWKAFISANPNHLGK